jgi:UPF0271 protein
MRVDLNADLGESFGACVIGHDAAVLRSITSANIACGFHGGDPSVIRRTVRMALAARVAVGAHPGFPDLIGFGRREMRVAEADLEDLVLYQIGALAGIVSAEGGSLHHVKPHGALYQMAARERPVANAIARAVRAFDPTLIFFAPSGSQLARAGMAAGLRVACEVFADRAYQPDGTLVPRHEPGAVIDDPDAVVTRVTRMVRDRTVAAFDGSLVAVTVDTICVHGDTPGSAELAARIRASLEAAGVTLGSVGLPAAG